MSTSRRPAGAGLRGRRADGLTPALAGLAVVAALLYVLPAAREAFDGRALDNAARVLRDAFPPRLDAGFLGLLVVPALETLGIAVAGTALACLIGAPLGLLATSTLMWQGVLHERARPARRWALGVLPALGARLVLAGCRAIPEYVWALVFVRAVGLGPTAAVLAIGVAYGGMLGKVYAEILEGVNPRPLEALRASGAGRLATALYGLLPQALPHVASYTLYRWECAIRASAILGFVGAGGLGQQLELSLRMFRFDEVLTLLVGLLVLVAGADAVGGVWRERLVGPARPVSGSRLRARLVAGAGALAALWLVARLDLEPAAVLGADGLRSMGAFAVGLWPPAADWESLDRIVRAALETLAVSIAGTALALAAALPLALAATRTILYRGALWEREPRGTLARAALGAVAASSRLVLGALRTVPELVWAVVLVAVVGLGPLAGALALAAHTAGVLGKLVADTLEAASPRTLVALAGTGAGRTAVVLYGALPEAAPELAAYTLYRWEVNIRAAAVLGVVGAGGLGQEVHLAIGLFRDQELLVLLGALGLIVIAVEVLSAALRARLR